MSDASKPSAPDAEFPDDAVEVGRIVDAWGVKGWVRVQPYSKDPQALFSSKRWFLRPGPKAAAARSTAAPLPPLVRVTQAREHGDDVVAGLHDIDDRAAAEALRGARVYVARSSFPTAGTDEYYWVDLIGLQVRNRAGDMLGEVVDLLDTGAHCVLRVRAPGAAVADERLIPFVAAYVDDVDRAGRCITVDWGLDY